MEQSNRNITTAETLTSERERNLAKENGETQQANINDENMQDLDDQQPSEKDRQLQKQLRKDTENEVCKLSNETGSVVFDLVTLGKWDMEGRLRHNATETFAKLQQAYGDSVLSRTHICQRPRWFKAFSEGRESIENEPRSGRPTVSKTAEIVVRVRDLVRSDLRLTLRMIGEELNMNYTTVHQILTNELKMRKICAFLSEPFLGQ
ncbi:HTH_48 domain-containing protein [Trichonephila clavipes]|nr:HTH_48 domain-containing protein [Trichonephila clavipes]